MSRDRELQPKVGKKVSKRRDAPGTVLKLVERLGQQMLQYRVREGLPQKEMAARLGIGITTYNSIETMRNQDGEYGCSLALIVRFCELEGLRPSELFASLEGENTPPTAREEYEEAIVRIMSSLSTDQRKEFTTVFGGESEVSAIPERARWWADLGIDLFAMDENERLEFEMNVQKALLKRLPANHPKTKVHRERIFSLMDSILNKP